MTPPAGRPTWVVIPALDEADHIVACLAALGAAAGAAPGPVHAVVVDDGSGDGTADLARAVLAGQPGEHAVVAGPGRGVGWARRAGFEHALAASARPASAPAARRADAGATATALIATTDADSRVAPDWLAVLHRHLDGGHSVIAGDVHLDPATDAGLVAARAHRLRRRLTGLPPGETGAPHPHFAGANLGFSAEALRQLGPLPAPRTLEDAALLDRFRQLEIPVLRCADTQVVTSARVHGRAPGGLAAALSRDAAQLASA